MSRLSSLVLLAGVALVLMGALFFLVILPGRQGDQATDGATTPLAEAPQSDQEATPVFNPNARQTQIGPYILTLDVQPELMAYLISEGPPANVSPVTEPLGEGEQELVIPTLPPEVNSPATEIPQPTIALEPILEPTAVPQTAPAGSGAEIILVGYTVQVGDTLYRIASLHSTSVSLMAEYGIDQDDLIAGNVLQIPQANPAFCPGLTAYVVREGDTAFSIARAFGVTLDQVQSLNNLNADYYIRAGQVLCLP